MWGLRRGGGTDERGVRELLTLGSHKVLPWPADAAVPGDAELRGAAQLCVGRAEPDTYRYLTPEWLISLFSTAPAAPQALGMSGCVLALPPELVPSPADRPSSFTNLRTS